MVIYFSKVNGPERRNIDDPGPLLPPRTVLRPPEETPDQFRIDKREMDEWIAETGLIELKQCGMTFHLEREEGEEG